MAVDHILVTRAIPEPGLEMLRATGARVDVCRRGEEAYLTHEEVLAGVGGCDVVVALLSESIDREVLEAAGERLRGVANYAVGFNNVDVAAATELGIPVSNTPGVLSDTTADCTWAMILAVARRIPEAHAYMTSGRYKIWVPELLVGSDVSPGGSGRRKVLGVVGYGRIGRAVAQRSTGFDMDVLAYSPRRRREIEEDPLAAWAELDDLLEQSDFVTVHTPLHSETRHLIGAEQLRRMKTTAYLINTSRGPVIDEKALVEALAKGWIAGAALDVYEDEPRMAPGLAESNNVVLLPHIGSGSLDTRTKMATMAATNAVAHLRRERAPNPVNPGVYDTEAYRRRMERS